MFSVLSFDKLLSNYIPVTTGVKYPLVPFINYSNKIICGYGQSTQVVVVLDNKYIISSVNGYVFVYAPEDKLPNYGYTLNNAKGNNKCLCGALLPSGNEYCGNIYIFSTGKYYIIKSNVFNPIYPHEMLYLNPDVLISHNFIQSIAYGTTLFIQR